MLTAAFRGECWLTSFFQKDDILVHRLACTLKYWYWRSPASILAKYSEYLTLVTVTICDHISLRGILPHLGPYLSEVMI